MTTSPLNSKPVTQIGLIVGDIEATIQVWSAILGVSAPEILVTGLVEEAQTEYQGHSTPARAKLAFFDLGTITLELIEPIDEPSTWNDQLVAHGPSLHHIAFEVKGMSDSLAALAEHGLPLVQRGEYEGGRYAYVDGSERFGAIIELLEND